MKKLAITTIILTIVDQIIKIVISSNITLGRIIPIIDNFFNITNVHNDGAAWSILRDKQYFLIAIAIFALVVIYRTFLKNKNLTRIDMVLYSMLLAGIVGNLLDRIIYGYVIDYLDFYIFNYNFPVFNLADTLIVLAAIGLVIKTFKEEKNAKNKRNS